MTQKLFVYGTLQFPEILKRLTGKIFTMKPATLNGFKRCCVKGCDYPALIETKDAITNGIILENVDEKSLKAIDYFEGDEYEKTGVTVLVNGLEVSAITYVWVAEKKRLECTDWDRSFFESNFLIKYLK